MLWEKKTCRQKSDNLVLGATGANKDFTACFWALVPDGGREALCLQVVKITGFPPSVFGRKADARAPFKQTINFARKLIDVIKSMVPFIGQQLA